MIHSMSMTDALEAVRKQTAFLQIKYIHGVLTLYVCREGDGRIEVQCSGLLAKTWLSHFEKDLKSQV